MNIKQYIRRAFPVLAILIVLVSFSSCLKSGMDDPEDSGQNAITNVTMEYRWIEQNANGYDQMVRQQMTLKNLSIKNNEIHFDVVVPTAGTNFPSLVRDQVQLDGLYMITVISSAAKITPLNDSPKLGVPGAWEVGTKYYYQVTAANGEVAIYTIVIDSFTK